jgi:multidrug efflux pump subunit AcrB
MLSLWMSGFPIGFNPIIGSTGLIGVAINDTIIVLAAIRSNAKAYAGDVEEIVKEVMGTSRHILSTTLTTAGGFAPLLLSGGTFWPPLAVVIAGGIILATFLAMVFTPTIYAVLAPRLFTEKKDEKELSVTEVPA